MRLNHSSVIQLKLQYMLNKIFRFLIQKELLMLCNTYWLFGLFQIIYTGLRPYPHYITGEMLSSDAIAIAYYCIFFSLYFLIANILMIFRIHLKYRYSSYLTLSCILFFQLFIGVLSSMHAPPFIANYMLLTLLLTLFHFILYPLFLCFVRKKPASA